ncbi:Ribose-phosphate pyrophosphokinase [Chitinispirillum alkaliphilum]|nr:Ribose-phosphate pyrophosphokinase [Chitinispirillum alkaliphilum]
MQLLDSTLFITPEQFRQKRELKISGPNGWLLFVACNDGIELAKSVKRKYESLLKNHGSAQTRVPLTGTENQPLTRIFSDSETCPRLTQPVAGANAYIFQNIHHNCSPNSVNENIQQLLQAVRTLSAHRAKSITVVTPYIPYSRQEKPSYMSREAALASLFADQLKAAGAHICLTYHPHTLSLYGFYEPEMVLVSLSGLDLFASIFSHLDINNAIAVSTDAGGAKFTLHFSDLLDIPYAIANKFRPGKEKTNFLGIIGDVEGKKAAIVLDDETVTGSSLINTIKTIHQSYKVQEIYAAVSHNKIQKKYIPLLIEAWEKYGLKELHTTDSIPQTDEVKSLPFVKTHPLDNLFASTINRLHYNQSVSELFLHS